MSDDVSEKVREERKKLIKRMKELRADDQFALVPFSVPAVLLTKKDGKLIRITIDNL